MSYPRLYSFFALSLITAGAAWPQIVLDSVPARDMGRPYAEQISVTNVNPNFGPHGGMYAPSGIAVDTSVSPPILYVSDTQNNRVLAWKNATSATLTNLQAPDMVIGQPDFNTSLPGVDGTNGASGLQYPSGLVVDAKGNLYIADLGNNRVVRYPTPFATNNNNRTPDLVLGQGDPFLSRNPNRGPAIYNVGAAAADTLYFYNTNPSLLYSASLAIDGSGNLYVTDTNNWRVLGWPASSLTAGNYGLPATIVIGQSSFSSVATPMGATDLNHLYIPSGVAFDSAGHLFVADEVGRMLVYAPPAANATGPSAIRVAGIVQGASGPTQSTLSSPGGLVMINNGPAVADSGNNRVLVFDPFSSSDWTATTSTPTPLAINAIGQPNYTSGSANQGKTQASAGSLYNPAAMAVAGTDLFVADSGNNRVLVYSNLGTSGNAAVALGQGVGTGSNPNSVSGSGFWFAPGASNNGDAGLAVDTSSNPPHLYVADPGNNRVLGFADARKAGPGLAPDIVLGQKDFVTGVCNYGGVAVANPASGQLPQQPTQSSLCYPTGLTVDSKTGDLYVADSKNGRVVRFAAPFQSGVTSMQMADLVLGQSVFTGLKNPAVNANFMGFPYGVVFDESNGLLVSDFQYNRVLFFETAGLSNGAAATKVIGQSDFSSRGSTVLSQPHHIAVDSSDRVYVADSAHGQVLIFNSVQFLAAATTASLLSLPGFNYPQALWVNPASVAGYTGDIWVGDSSNGVLRFGNYGSLSTTQNNASTYQIQPATLKAGQSTQCPSGGNDCELAAVAITQDGYGNLYIADDSNRISVHFAALGTRNGANFLCAGPLDVNGNCTLDGLAERGYYLSPGLVASTFMFPGVQFTQTPASFNSLPVPTTIGGIQLLVNGVAAPIFDVLPGQINFVVPQTTPASGTVELEAVVAATGQVLGSGSAAMNPVAPAMFTSNSSGIGELAAINCNQTPCETTNFINSASNPVVRGGIIELFGTGQGNLPGEPPDGQLPTSLVNTPTPPAVFIGGFQVPSSAILFSGLAPCCVGLWQINVQVPNSTAPGNMVSVLVSYENFTSFNDPAHLTYIAVK